jgi:hypothetical protein
MKLVSNVVFTKNRPLQLDAYLESLSRYFPAGLIQTYVLYKKELFEEQYKQLFRRYSGCIVVEERDFSSDFLRLLEEINTKFVLFGVDDVVYFDAVDFEAIDRTFDSFDDIFGFSLRFGESVLDNGRDKTETIEINGRKIHKLNWQQGQTKSTSYPFELCATVYRTELVKKIINFSRSTSPAAVKLFSPSSVLIKGLKQIGLARKVLKKFGFFYNPNTLESWNCRWCRNHSGLLPAFIYFQKQCASVIQVNMVNTSTVNLTDGNVQHTVEVLAERYKQGYRLDIDFIAANKPAETHCGTECFKLVKRS